MGNPIEEVVSQEQKHWKRFLIAFFMGLTLLGVRYMFGTVFREHELNSHPVGMAVLSATVLALVGMVFSVVRLGQLAAKAKADPKLKEALIDDELTRLEVGKSWKAGFIGAALTPFAFLLLSSLYPIDDPVLVALATPSIGAAAFLTSFYLKKRS
jgi:hypothetical protein